MPNEKISLRRGTEADAELLLEFIRALAEYEHLIVSSDAEILRRDVFLDKRAEAVFAEIAGQPVGMALFFFTYSTFSGRKVIYLEDIFVKDAFRGQGIGKELLCYVARLAVEQNCDRLDWAALSWNKPAQDFYQKLGAVPLQGWDRYFLYGEALQKLAGCPTGSGNTTGH
ncbi:acetyltransferase GNAT family protein [Candidatus Termititenax aidoneus]|uniref:Acetyltransferase GNAT family protein n=1 Tax=Termititenax aidoneus TaxID=2218524 RepID=A0A388TAW0_TERA1|nr:acetyltransferase GNAT family protein [Candidatus Termititenax aidoneus]